VILMRDFLLRMLRVPPEPDPPPGNPDRVRTFRAGRGYLRYRTVLWLLKQASTLFGAVFGYLFVRAVVGEIGLSPRWVQLVETVVIAGFVVQLPFSYAVMKLNYELRWYILTDRSLRIRHGVINVREQTLTYANVQNISVRQNPVQRAFGIASVAVRSAGGGSSSGGHAAAAGSQGSSMHEAVFEGVDNADEIRAAIRDCIRHQRDAGLGDPDELEPGSALASGAAHASPALAAAHTLLHEARALRAVLAPPR
jgi:membrane protein YdbS with pleckstrin-like domain